MMLHLFYKFIKDKANFSLNTDDPLVFNSTIHTDYTIAAEYMNFSDAEFMTTVCGKKCLLFTVDGSLFHYLFMGSVQPLLIEMCSSNKPSSGK